MPKHFAPIAAVLALAVIGCGSGDKTTSDTTPTQPSRATPVGASVADLRALQKEVGHDVFWAGRQKGFTYELSRTTDGNVYIRYLPPGVPVGAAGADFLSIGTYPQPDAFTTIHEASKRAGETVVKIPNAGVAVSSPDRPQSVYFAYPGSKLLVEVYASDPVHALDLVRHSRVVPLR